jgi:hypothetical protein
VAVARRSTSQIHWVAASSLGKWLLALCGALRYGFSRTVIVRSVTQRGFFPQSKCWIYRRTPHAFSLRLGSNAALPSDLIVCQFTPLDDWRDF